MLEIVRPVAGAPEESVARPTMSTRDTDDGSLSERHPLRRCAPEHDRDTVGVTDVDSVAA
jgi:hypothetical protein